MNTGASVNGGGVSGYTADVQNAAEITMAPSGGLGESEVGGPAMNIVPRTGGNTFKFYSYASFTGGNSRAATSRRNCRPPACARPARSTAVGRQRVGRRPDREGQGLVLHDPPPPRQLQDVVGMYYNNNAGDITKWTYEADTSRPAVSESRTPIQPLAR